MLENEYREVLFYVCLQVQRYLLTVLVICAEFYLRQVQQSIFDQFQLYVVDLPQELNLLPLIVIRIRLCQALLTLEINI